MRTRTSGFTLAEVLVVIAIITLLVTLLIPTFGAARDRTRLTLCASNLRQQGQMIGQYATDCKNYIPQNVTRHGIINGTYTGGGANMCAISTDEAAVATSCKEISTGVNNYQPGCRNQPVGQGWFYFMGYIPPVTNTDGKLGCLSCPASPAVSRVNNPARRNLPMTANYGIYYPTMTATMASGSYNHLSRAVGDMMGGNNYDCVGFLRSDYYYRGWASTTTSVPWPKMGQWKPTNATTVDFESVDFACPYGTAVAASPDSQWYLKVHPGMLNVLFIGGNVNIGGKYMSVPGYESSGPQPPHAYYTVVKESRTLGAAMGTGQGGCSGWPYAGGSSFTAVWSYYETGVP